MGTTLEHGVYLPNEGERNCYAGLKTNWEILDQKVADVTALQQAVAGALHREIVESLPTTDIDPNTIYMILSGTSATENVYNEFMYVNNAWELIGTSATDLTNYYTKGEVDGKLLLKANDNAVVHNSGAETVAGIKTFSDDTYIKTLNFTNEVASTSSSSSAIMPIITTVTYTDQTASKSARINLRITGGGDKSLYPHENNQYALGLTSRKWSEVHGVTYYYGTSDTEFSNKFMTTDTDQTVSSIKTFSNIISSDGSYLGNESSTNERTNICLRSNRDTADQSGAYISRFRANKNQGELLGSDSSFISISFLENGTRYTRCFDLGLTDWDTDGIPQTYYLTSPGSKGALGTSSRKWQSFNGLEPSSLGMPDLANGIDISSYITHLDKLVNSYTPPVNGYVLIRVKKTSLPIVSIRIQQNYGLITSCETTDFSTWGTYLPVVAGQIVEVYISADSLMSAIFFPCQGNV